ncbi:MAG TPA: FtsX-like permease family protein [Phycisphaerae bacterium]|nr:FtsX-like permease family protein [Phycisphaerae bacterium]
MAIPLYYNWRNLLARRLSTILTLVVVAVIIVVLCTLLSFAAGIRASLVATGSSINVIVLKPGATAESTSIIQPEESIRLAQTPDVARDAAGNLLMSTEVCVQTDIPRKGQGGASANVALRGVDDVAFAVHPEVHITEGRNFRQGMLEVIVGKAACARFAGLNLGAEVSLGRHGQRQYQVVGIFEAKGGALESEIWAPRTMLCDSYQRRMASSVCLRMSDAASAPAAIEYINGPTVQLDGKLETKYYDDLASKTRDIVVLTTVLVGIMAVGAVFAVANTMYSSVDGRRREIAMLRAIGFSRSAIVLALVTESLLLSSIAWACGLGACTLVMPLIGQRQDFLSDQTWTVLAYELRLTPMIIVAALALAVIVGATGAVAPALRAARLDVLEALRKA